MGTGLPVRTCHAIVAVLLSQLGGCGPTASDYAGLYDVVSGSGTTKVQFPDGGTTTAETTLADNRSAGNVDGAPFLLEVGTDGDIVFHENGIAVTHFEVHGRSAKDPNPIMSFGGIKESNVKILSPFIDELRMTNERGLLRRHVEGESESSDHPGFTVRVALDVAYRRR